MLDRNPKYALDMCSKSLNLVKNQLQNIRRKAPQAEPTLNELQ